MQRQPDAAQRQDLEGEREYVHDRSLRVGHRFSRETLLFPSSSSFFFLCLESFGDAPTCEVRVNDLCDNEASRNASSSAVCVNVVLRRLFINGQREYFRCRVFSSCCQCASSVGYDVVQRVHVVDHEAEGSWRFWMMTNMVIVKFVTMPFECFCKSGMWCIFLTLEGKYVNRNYNNVKFFI